MQFFGQFELDKFLFETYFKDVKNGFFIECGAVDGILEITCLSFEKFLNWNGVNIEPAKPNYDRLIKNRPNSINLNIALSNKNGHATFKHAIHPDLGDRFGNGSLTHTKHHLNDLIRNGCKFKDYEIQTKTYKTLMDEINPPRFDLFVLDVEGHELQVIEGIGNCKILPRVLCIEHGHLGIDVVRKALSPKGFKFDRIYANNAIFLNNL